MGGQIVHGVLAEVRHHNNAPPRHHSTPCALPLPLVRRLCQRTKSTLDQLVDWSGTPMSGKVAWPEHDGLTSDVDCIGMTGFVGQDVHDNILDGLLQAYFGRF